MKFLKILILITAVSLFFSGCSVTSFNSTELMRPPRATGEKAEIQLVINEQAGGEYTLKYPQNGDYRSAIITCDLDNDNSEEAIALFHNKEEAAGINILIIDEIDGKWQAVGNFSNPCTEVDRVCITDLNGDGTEEIIVGWGTYSSSFNQLTAYIFNKASVNEIIIEETYTDFVSSDLNGDGLDEIVLLSLGTSEAPASAKLLEMSESASAVYTISSAQMNSDVVRYISVSSAVIDKTDKGNVNGIVIDGLLVDNTVFTQVIYCGKEGGLLNPLTADSKQPEYPKTESTLSLDINSDGIIEIPFAEQLPRDLTESNEPCPAYSWYKLDTSKNRLTEAAYTVADYKNGYYMRIPHSWINNVTAYYDDKKETITFYEWDPSSASPKGDPLMKITAAAATGSVNLSGDYNVVSKDSNTVYIINLFKIYNESLTITKEQIKEYFYLI